MLEKIKDPDFFILFLSVWSCVALPILWYWKLLALPKQAKPDNKSDTKTGSKSGTRMALMSPLLAFLIFVAVCGFVPTWIKMLLNYFDTHGVSAFSALETDKFPQLIALIVSCILLVGFSCIHSSEIQALIWGQKPGLKFAVLSIGKGIFFSLLTYPLVMLLVQGIHLAVEWFGQVPYNEQVALAELKSLQPIPWLFWSFALAVVTLVPVIEELLFRGFLQNFCADFLGAKGAIIVASLLFCLFHYSGEQAATNIELMVGLFVYSYFMGIFYIKERSLWVNIGMHGAFNVFSLFLMLYLPL